ncbi:MAG: DUF6798 domain-containing protein [Bacteroidota bacterium]
MTAPIPYFKKQSGFWAGAAISLICVVYQSLYRAVPWNGDLMIGLPIAKEFAHPGLFSPYDLIVSSGIREPYHLYKYLGGFLYGIHANIDFIWEGLFLCFLFLTFLSFWFLSLELTQDKLSSALVLAFIAVAHPLRGSLHAAAVPTPSFVTTLAAMPLAIAAIVFLLRKRFFVAVALSSFVFNIHPYVGVLAASAIAAGVFFNSGERLSKRAVAIVGGGLFALPNVIYILSHFSKNFVPVGYDFYAQFRLYAMHVFVDEHWREGYGWFFVNLAGAVLFARYIDRWKRSVVRTLFACWFGLMAVYAFNSYVTKSTPILVMFLFRATYFIKPIVFIFIVHGIRRWRIELRNTLGDISWWKPWELSAAIALLFFSSILPMNMAVVADALALLAYGFITRQVARDTKSYQFFFGSVLFVGVALLLTLIIFQFSRFAESQAAVENVVVGIVVVYALSLLWVFRKLNRTIQSIPLEHSQRTLTSRAIVAALSVVLIHHLIISLKDRHIPFVPDLDKIEERIMMHRAPERTAALMQWARTATPQGSLFVVPPDAWDDFGAFRIIAERGLYITCNEVNQLAFDASIYQQGNQRVASLGVKITGPHTFDASGYYELTLPDLQRLCAQDHADFIVFEKKQLHGVLSSLSTVYHDEIYVVINLHDLMKK